MTELRSNFIDVIKYKQDNREQIMRGQLKVSLQLIHSSSVDLFDCVWMLDPSIVELHYFTH